MKLVIPVMIALFLVFVMCTEKERYKVYMVKCSEQLSVPFAFPQEPTSGEVTAYCKEKLKDAR